AGLPGNLVREPAVELRVELAQYRHVRDWKAHRRRLRLVGREDLVRPRQQCLRARENLLHRPPELAAEEERGGIGPRGEGRLEGRSHWLRGELWSKRTVGQSQGN